VNNQTFLLLDGFGCGNFFPFHMQPFMLQKPHVEHDQGSMCMCVGLIMITLFKVITPTSKRMTTTHQEEVEWVEGKVCNYSCTR
jgi:hypothetical protein